MHLLRGSNDKKGLFLLFGSWSRFVMLFSIAAFKSIFPQTAFIHSNLFYFAVFSLVVFSFTLFFSFKDKESQSWFLNIALILVFIMSPYLPIMEHFQIIQLSMFLFWCFLAFFWCFFRENNENKSWNFFVAAVSFLLIAGTYQSALYGLFVLVSFKIYLFSLKKPILKEFLQYIFIVFSGLVLGFVLYLVAADLVASNIVAKKVIFQKLELSEIINNIPSYFQAGFGHVRRGKDLFPSWLFRLMFVHIVFMLSFLFYKSHRNFQSLFSLFGLAFAFIFVLLQMLSWPYSFGSFPLRAYWALPLFYILLVKVFSLKNKNISYFNFALVSLVAAYFCFGQLKLEKGLTSLRERDYEILNSISNKINEGELLGNKDIAFAFSSKRAMNRYHKNVIGSMRSLMFSPWSGVAALKRVHGDVLRQAPKEIYGLGTELCASTVGSSSQYSLYYFKEKTVFVCLH